MRLGGITQRMRSCLDVVCVCVWPPVQDELLLTLSCLGGRLGGILSLAIHISPNNGVINMIQSDKLVVNVLTMH